MKTDITFFKMQVRVTNLGRIPKIVLLFKCLKFKGKCIYTSCLI